jgi:hypothetical protein
MSRKIEITDRVKNIDPETVSLIELSINFQSSKKDSKEMKPTKQ